jgi:ferredoxin-NADP reductase
MAEEMELKLEEIINRTYNVKSFRLEVKGDISYKAGQFLQVFLKSGQGELSHYFSISNSPTEKGYLEFTKKITESEFSLLLDSLKTGDTLKIKYPFGAFTFEGEYPKIAFLSGGIGITPIRSIIKYVIDKKLDTDMVLMYANRSSKDIAFKDDFDIMQKVNPKLKVVYLISEAEAGWQGKVGHINSLMIKEEIPDYASRRFYSCGPPLMVEAIKKILLEELALSKEKIITENFMGY